jgi:uncharacterized RDD family membrane protein YckC
MNDVSGSRRLVAFLIDCLVFLGLAIAILYPLSRVNDDLFRIGSPLPEISSSTVTTRRDGVATAQVSGTWITSDCTIPRPVPDAILAPIAPVEPDEVWVCADRFMGIAAGHTANVTYGFKRTGNTATWQSYTLPVTVEGQPIRAIYPVGVLTFGLMFLTAVVFGGRTPGKALTGLRIESVDGTCLRCREMRRLGPFFLAAAASLLTGLLAPELGGIAAFQWMWFGATIAFWLFALWYYALPFMTDAGRARYDWATKFRVVLA